MKKIHRVLALLMAALMVIGLMTTAFAEPTMQHRQPSSGNTPYQLSASIVPAATAAS